MSRQRRPGYGPGDHPDLETFAELDEDLVPAPQRAALDEHLSGCSECRQAQSRLRDTRALLAALPADEMPADVAQRVDAALAGAVAGGAGTIVPLHASRRPWRSHPTAAGLGAAATFAALVAAIVVGATHHHSSDGSAEQAGGASTAGLGAATTPLPATVSGDTYTKTNTARLVAGLIHPTSGSGTVAGTGAGTGGTSAAGPTTSVAPSAGAAPSAPTTGPRSKAAAGLAPTLDPALLSLYRDPAALQRCIAALTGGGPSAAPIAVDFARYTDPARHVRRTPVIVIVLPGLRAGADDAWVVGPQCATAPDNNLYLYQSVPSTP